MQINPKMKSNDSNPKIFNTIQLIFLGSILSGCGTSSQYGYMQRDPYSHYSNPVNGIDALPVQNSGVGSGSIRRFGSVFNSDGSSSSRIGNTTHHSDGTYSSKIGNTTYHSDGSYSSRIGNTLYNSDGSSSSRIGNTTYNSDGSYSSRIGKTIYHSDGSYSIINE